MDGWHAHIWAAYVGIFNGRPISRSKLRDITGVPESTQRKYESSLGVRHFSNYIITNDPIENLNGIREFYYPNAFEFWDNANRRWVIARRGPDSRDASDFATSLNPGRSKKINQELSQYCGSLNVERAQSDNGLCIRQFNETHEQLKATERKLRKAGISNSEVSEIFELRHKGKNADFWQEVQKLLSKQKKSKEPSGKRTGLTDSETELWLKQFGLKQ